MVALTTREKAHRSKLVKEYNRLIDEKKKAYDKLMEYEKVLANRGHQG